MPTRFPSLPLALVLAACLAVAGGCTIRYSFTGASISPDVKTVSIDRFQNLSGMVNPTLSGFLAEELKNRFVSQTNLRLVGARGHLAFSGEIRTYQVAPMAIQQNEVAAMNRLTIGVRVRFENAKDPTQNFDRTFSRFADFPSTQQFAQVEQTLVAIIVEQVVDDIFTNAVANW